MAPELQNEVAKLEDPTKIDVYALGVTLKKIMGFEELLMANVGSGGQILKTPSPFRADPELEKMLNKMTDQDPEKRPTLKDVMNQLRALRADLLSVYPMTTGIVFISDYEAAKDKQAFIAALR